MGALLPRPQTAKKSTFSFRYRESPNFDHLLNFPSTFLKNSVKLSFQKMGEYMSVYNLHHHKWCYLIGNI
jgi:hypothetical protein